LLSHAVEGRRSRLQWSSRQWLVTIESPITRLAIVMIGNQHGSMYLLLPCPKGQSLAHLVMEKTAQQEQEVAQCTTQPSRVFRSTATELPGD
jgi:hypothetical protein